MISVCFEGTLPQMKSTVIVPEISTGPVNLSGTTPGIVLVLVNIYKNTLCYIKFYTESWMRLN